MNDVAKNILLWAVIAVILLSVFSNFSKPTGKAQPLSYSTFIQMSKLQPQSYKLRPNGTLKYWE